MKLCRGKCKDSMWTRSADDVTWVHPTCQQPSFLVWKGQQMLNIFQGGEKHNTILETEDVIKTAGAWITSYKWTPETITGSVSGKIARVWRYDPPSN